MLKISDQNMEKEFGLALPSRNRLSNLNHYNITGRSLSQEKRKRQEAVSINEEYESDNINFLCFIRLKKGIAKFGNKIENCLHVVSIFMNYSGTKGEPVVLGRY